MIFFGKIFFSQLKQPVIPHLCKHRNEEKNCSCTFTLKARLKNITTTNYVDITQIVSDYSMHQVYFLAFLSLFRLL